MCGLLDPLSCVVSSASSDIISTIASSVQDAEANIVGSLAAMWVQIPTPTIGSGSSASPIGAAGVIWQSTTWLVGFFAVLGLLITAGKLAWQRRAEPAKAAFQGMLNLVLVTSCGVMGIDLATKAGDGYSVWILNTALGTDPNSPTVSSNVNDAMKNLATGAAQGASAMLIIVLGLFGIISCVIQLIMMFVRVAMLGLLTSILPITASISGTQKGAESFKKACGWLLSFILYKPVAATIYAYAILEMKINSAQGMLAGMTMIIMAAVALPALMRFIVPVVSSAGGGSALGGALAGEAMAGGARMVGKAAGKGGGGGASGAAAKGGAGGASQVAGKAHPALMAVMAAKQGVDKMKDTVKGAVNENTNGDGPSGGK
jgi:type IV secretion system protein TrbL